MDDFRDRTDPLPEVELYGNEASVLLADDEKDSIKSQILAYWCVHFPFSLHLAWISFETIDNVAIMLKSFRVDYWEGGLC